MEVLSGLFAAGVLLPNSLMFHVEHCSARLGLRLHTFIHRSIWQVVFPLPSAGLWCSLLRSHPKPMGFPGLARERSRGPARPHHANLLALVLAAQLFHVEHQSNERAVDR